MEYLLEEGAQLDARSKWTDMTALHYAAYFDVPSIVLVLISRGAGEHCSSSTILRADESLLWFCGWSGAAGVNSLLI